MGKEKDLQNPIEEYFEKVWKPIAKTIDSCIKQSEKENNYKFSKDQKDLIIMLSLIHLANKRGKYGKS